MQTVVTGLDWQRPALLGQTTTTTQALGWTISQYQALAATIAQGASSPLALITIGRDGASPRAIPFSDRGALYDAYSVAAERPGERVYIAAFEDGEIADEAFFVAQAETTVQVTKTQWQKAWPYVVATGSAVALGMLAIRFARLKRLRTASAPAAAVSGWRRRQHRRKRKRRSWRYS